MSKSVNKNAVDIYFKNLREYIDDNRIGGGVEFLKEIKTELLYLLLMNGQSGGGKLSKIFIQHCNDSINYCNLLESKILLSESVNRVSDPTYEQMVDYIKSVFGDDVDEFDLNGGIYYFASHYYDGQTSNLYRAIHQTGYKPGVMSKEPMSFTDYEYVYLLYNIKYDIDDYEKYEDDELPDDMRFVVKKSQVMQDGGGIDRDDLEALMVEYISEVTGYAVDSYEFRLISSSVVEGENDTMNAVYRALINKFASVSFDVGGKHDELPPGEHHELPPGIKETKTNMNENTISISEVKNLINEVIAETLQQEVGAVDYNDYEPNASKDGVAGDYLADMKQTVDQLIKQVETETGDYDKAYDRLVKIYKQLTNAIDNPRLSKIEKEKLEHDYEGLLGNIHRTIGGGGGGSEKFYVAEALNDKNKQLIIKWVNEMGTRKAAIRMIDSILKRKVGLGTDDLADTSTFADGVDSVEEALQQSDYDGAYNIAYDTAQSMIEEEGGEGLFEVEGNSGKFSVYYQEKNPSSVSKSGGWRIAKTFINKIAAEKFAKDPVNKKEYGEMYVDKYDPEYDGLDESLFECGSWNEAIKHPMFKEAVLTEKAPPGMEKWIKANKANFIKKYGAKKGMSVLYATAWKMFYNKKGK